MSCEVHYELSGPVGAPVVAFSNSLGTDLSMWDPQAARISERMRVLRYDQRGHGRSPVPDGPYSIEDLGSDLVALLDRLEIERASLCGLSIGGMTCIWAAANAPDRVERLAVCCSSAHLDPEGSYRERAAVVRERGLEAIAEAVLARWFTDGFARTDPEVVERRRQNLLQTPREGYAGCCEALAGLDLRSSLSDVTGADARDLRTRRSGHAAGARPADRRSHRGSAVRGRRRCSASGEPAAARGGRRADRATPSRLIAPDGAATRAIQLPNRRTE